MTKTRTTRALVLIALAGAFVLASCTPDEQSLFTAIWERNQALAASDKFAGAVSNDGLARLRACESGGRYNAVSASGTYRGAYQFSRTTWNSVASRHYGHLNRVDPAAAAPHDQDRMARALWATSGRGQWPVCGRRV